jgi:hypothetical protein
MVFRFKKKIQTALNYCWLTILLSFKFFSLFLMKIFHKLRILFLGIFKKKLLILNYPIKIKLITFFIIPIRSMYINLAAL